MAYEIYPIPMGLDTIYAVRGEKVIIIDGGDPNRIERFKAGLEKAGIDPGEVDLIILTHGHWDHVGSARDIKVLTGARVMLHKDDLHLLQSDVPRQPPGFTLFGKFLHGGLKLISPLIHIPEFEVDLVLEEEEVALDEFGIHAEIVHTPGHSWGSVSVLLPDGHAFVGDLAMNGPLKLYNPGLPIFGDDMEVVKESWRNLLQRDVRIIYPAHGSPFSAEVMRQALR